MYLYFGIQYKQNLVHRSMYANMPICTYAHIWKYESMQLCKFASMHVHAYMQERACPYPRLRDFLRYCLQSYKNSNPDVLYINQFKYFVTGPSKLKNVLKFKCWSGYVVRG